MRALTHPFTQWVILGVAVMAFFIVAKLAAGRLPDGGVTGAIKNAVNAA